MKRYARCLRPVFLLPILAFCLFGCDFDKRQFIDVAKNTYESFYNGSRAADTTIDWRVVRINDDEVGRMYADMTTDYERAEFRKSQIARLRSICNMKGWNITNVREWKIKDRGVESAIVAADGPGGSIVISMRKVGAQKRIEAIRIK